MKNIFLTILLVVTSSLQAQRIRTFLGIAAYRDTDFNKSVFGSASTGLEFKVVNNFRPEIELGVMYGTPETLTDYSETGLVKVFLKQKQLQLIIVFAPKFIWGILMIQIHA